MDGTLSSGLRMSLEEGTGYDKDTLTIYHGVRCLSSPRMDGKANLIRSLFKEIRFMNTGKRLASSFTPSFLPIWTSAANAGHVQAPSSTWALVVSLSLVTYCDMSTWR